MDKAIVATILATIGAGFYAGTCACFWAINTTLNHLERKKQT
jgi:hypothetical protein